MISNCKSLLLFLFFFGQPLSKEEYPTSTPFIKKVSNLGGKVLVRNLSECLLMLYLLCFGIYVHKTPVVIISSEG